MMTVQNVFYKFCFCLGLGTASYYSYAQVNHWVKGDAPVQTSSSATFQDKVHAIGNYESLTPEQHRAEMLRVAQASSFVQNPHASVDVNAVKPLIVAAPATDAAVTGEAVVADASPSPSPVDGEKKEGEKKEGEEAKTAEAGSEHPEAVPAPIPYAQPLMANGMPVPYAMLAAQYQPQSSAPEASASTAQASDLSMNPALGNIMPAGFNSGLTAGSSGSLGSSSSSGASASNSGSSSGVSTYNPGTSSGGSYSDISILSTADLAALTSPVQAAFQNEQLQVSGMVCAETVRASCTHQDNVGVHSLRWGTEEGLNQNVNFAVKAASGANPVQFDVQFKIQDRLLNEQTVSISAKPSEVLVHTESRDSKTYKVYEFKMPDTSVRSDDALTQVQATLVYEVTDSGMVMTSDSKFSFARDSVKTLNSNWNPEEPNRAPAQNELYFVADELPYSMSLQKSP